MGKFIWLIYFSYLNYDKYWDHQVKKGSTLGLISTALFEPESGYSSKLETSPRLLTTGT